jgi:hypothetical protein
MPITITPPVADITIGVTTYTNADWEANTPGTLSAVITALTGQVQALGDTTGTLVKAISNGTTTLSSGESANINFIFTGSLSGTANINFPSGSYTATIVNNTTGSQALSIGYSTGTRATIPAGGTAQVIGDGTNFRLVSGIAAGSSGAVSIPGTFTATGAATFSSTLAVTGDATFSGDVTIDQNLTATLDATFGQQITVTGDGNFLANCDIDGGLNVGLDSAFLQDLGVGGNLGVTGDAIVTGDIQGVTVAARHASLNTYLYGDATDGAETMVEFQTDGVVRWRVGRNSVGDLEFRWYNDSGVYQASPIIIDSATGYVKLAGYPTDSSGLASGTIWSNSGVLTLA